MSLDDHGKQKRDDDGLDHHIGEHEGLDYRIDSEFPGRDVCEDGSCTTHPVSDAQQKDVRGALQDRKANDRMHQMFAADKTIQSAKE
jgi:hypothetical protein